MFQSAFILVGGAVGTGTQPQAILSLPCAETWHAAIENSQQQPVLLLSENTPNELQRLHGVLDSIHDDDAC